MQGFSAISSSAPPQKKKATPFFSSHEQEAFFQPAVKPGLQTGAPSIQKQDEGATPPAPAPAPATGTAPATEPEAGTGTDTRTGPPTFRLELPRSLILSANGIGVSYPTMFIQGRNGTVIDLAPYTGNKAIDFPLAALESLGIPILSYFYFNHGPLRAYRGLEFSSAYGLSGGTSFIRNAIHYGYIKSDTTHLYGAPSSFAPEHYAGVPNLFLHANPMDIGTMINISYFNSPMEGQPNNPTIMFTLGASFESNPLEALVNIGGAVGHLFSGDLYSLPNVTHNYPDFSSRPRREAGR